MGRAVGLAAWPACAGPVLRRRRRRRASSARLAKMGGGIFVGNIDLRCTCMMMVFMLVFAMVRVCSCSREPRALCPAPCALRPVPCALSS